MNYELAKELKGAGFGNPYWEPSIEEERPDLGALIEACGEQFNDLARTKQGEWAAFSTEATHLLYGSTPEEAVARLWLALNPKKP